MSVRWSTETFLTEIRLFSQNLVSIQLLASRQTIDVSSHEIFQILIGSARVFLQI
ncbi:MAG: hypothetical protein HY717_01310 [Planctomycetes bacterium]|nr:hypothetical protein [Planctomycetota bacterium]